MKHKIQITQHLVCTSPAQLLRGDFDACLNLFGSDAYIPDEWAYFGPIDISFEVDLEALTEKTVAAIDAEIEKERAAFKARLDLLERRRNELAALPAPQPASDNVTRLEGRDGTG